MQKYYVIESMTTCLKYQRVVVSEQKKPDGKKMTNMQTLCEQNQLISTWLLRTERPEHTEMRFNQFRVYLSFCLSDGPTDWLTDWLIFAWLIGWLIEWMINWSNIDWLTVSFFYGCLVGWLVDCRFGWLID